ncbi:fungal-specific transcription factor domain-containing protein [Mycena vitilis]|nr:fungal-specific transcription factor domain-containing protein [Mycena vitilis]
MVSEVNQTGSEPRKRVRRSHGSCDGCKRRKIRCDRQIQGNRCTHCKKLGLDCTNSDITKTLPSESANGYVSALETRVEKMERLLTQEILQLLPGIDFTAQLGNEDRVEPLSLPQLHAELPRNDENIPSESFGKLKLHPEKNRFFGKSSGVQLLQTALNFRKQLTGVGLQEIRQRAARNRSALVQKHKTLWSAASFLLPPPTDDWIPQYTFPDADLLTTLVNLYFQEVNLYWPVLHHPTFNRKVAEKLHLRDHMFGSTLLMVCSLGARYSDDPRVLDDVESHQHRYDPLHSAGWKWHSQVRVIPEYLVYKPELYELQTIALSALYIQSTSTAWHQIGLGLRRAQDVGAHRRRSQAHPTAEDEQWKRVFWVLLCLEWVTGALTGRPLTMHSRDFDQDLPAECDDEFWDADFQQPKDRPSYLSYFICYARLLEIQAAVTTTIYSPRKPKDLGDPSSPTEAESIVALDSALNSWLNTVPEHLRWDPARKNALDLTQSALLHAAYYNLQILVHRPFIPFPFETPRSGSLPSLAICTNAARSCVRILDIQLERGISVKVDMLHAVFATALVLFLHAWSDEKSGFAAKDLEHIQTCLKITTTAEKRCA